MMKDPRQDGFTLVETLVAISILMISIIGPMYSVFQAVQTTYVARDQLIATALAQEGIEYVRHHRDNNYLYNLQNPSGKVGWMAGLSNCQGSGNTCMVDVTDSDATPPALCSSQGCNELTISSIGIYGYGYSTKTGFTRSVHIDTVDANEVIVTSTVKWVSAHVPFSITVTEHLYNWL